MPKLFWAGDSTVQYNSYLTYPQTGMGQVLPIFLKPDAVIENHAKNGRSTKSFLDEGRLEPIAEQIGEGDFLFIQFGHNDEKVSDPLRFTEPDGAYIQNLERFVNTARERKAHPVLITSLCRRTFDENGLLTEGEFKHRPYVEAMRQTAKRLEVPLIDLFEMSWETVQAAGDEETRQWYMHVPAGVYPYKPDGAADDTHLKYKGAVIFAGLIARGLRDLGGIYADLLLDEIKDRL